MAEQTEVRHGYTLHDIDQMTRAAIVADRLRAMPIEHRRDIAWEAIVLALFEAEHPPHRGSLIQEGWKAIYRHVRDGIRQRGYSDDRDWSSDEPNRPRFLMFWGSGVTPSHEDRVVERLATGQVLNVVDGPYRDAVLALAAQGDYLRAADSLGINYKALVARMGVARKRIDAAWFGDESPARRRTDRRVESHSSELATACGKGHEWAPGNTRVRQRIVNGKLKRERVCRACESDRSIARRSA